MKKEIRIEPFKHKLFDSAFPDTWQYECQVLRDKLDEVINYINYPKNKPNKVAPWNYRKVLKNFTYCPNCGKKIRR